MPHTHTPAVGEPEYPPDVLPFLFNASRELAASLETTTILEVLLRLLVPGFGDACMVHVFESGRRPPATRRAISEALQPWLTEWWEWLAGVTRPGVNRALRSASSEIGSTFRKRRKGASPGFGEFSYLTVPLRARRRILGALTVFSLEQRRRYAADDIAVGEALGAQAGLALDNARRYEEQHAIVKHLEAVGGELDMAQREWLRDDERRRIARELHDHAEQTFFAIGLTATTALDGPEPRSGAARRLAQALTEVGQLATAGAEQLRTAIFALNHAEFAAPGLVAALWKLIRTFEARTGVEADLVLTGPRRSVPTEVAEALHAVTCEALTNVERHAHAGSVVLGLYVGKRSISLSVQDDGAGGSPLMLKHLSNSATRFGLRGMRDRVRRLRGTLVAGPGPDGGFLVRVRIPLQPGAAA